MDARLVGSGVTAANEKHAELLLGLHDKDEFNIGRSIEADCLIRDVNISRKHAHLKFDKENNTWTITDNKSSNGVIINDSRLTPLIPYFLKNKDRISIPSAIHTYDWIYQIPEEEIIKEGSLSPGKDRAEKINHQIDESKQFQVEQILKEKEELDGKVKDGELIIKNLAEAKDHLALRLICDRAQFIENQDKERKEFEHKLSANREETIENQRKEFENKLANEREIMEMNQALAQEEIIELRAELDLKKKSDDEKEKVKTELQTREEEITELRAELDRKRKRDHDRENRTPKKSRSEEKARFLEKCNDELKCSICDDIFIDPMSLNCGHVYCQYCIESWKRECMKNSEFSCPNCRSKVTTTIRSLHLDNLVNSIYRDADEELKKDREELIQNRKAEQEKKLPKASKQAKRRRRRRGNQIAESIRPMLIMLE